MIIRRLDNRSVMRLGMLFLIVANLAVRFLHPTAHLSENAVDGVKGLFFGLAIGTLLLSVRRMASAGGKRKCA